MLECKRVCCVVRITHLAKNNDIRVAQRYLKALLLPIFTVAYVQCERRSSSGKVRQYRDWLGAKAIFPWLLKEGTPILFSVYADRRPKEL